ncbi:MAG: prepilin-type N-terminal cleavage/methylation domain-containing protein [Acidobacteriota bacterium]|nr:prepilin-type N-terminal cleavage/methylation domain-containing protein [Acidobacteriota bacterium]
MKPNRSKDKAQAGVTLIELLMVTAVIAVVATLALMQFGNSRGQFARQNVAQQLKQAFERARFDSVKRRVGAVNKAEVIVSSTSYSLTTDPNNNGVTTDPGDVLLHNTSGQNVTLTGDSMTMPVTVSFDKRGEVIAKDATDTVVNPVFLVCSGICSFSNDTPSNANIVLVTPTGTVNILAGGSTVPAFTAPAVTNVPVGTDINGDVTIP